LIECILIFVLVSPVNFQDIAVFPFPTKCKIKFSVTIRSYYRHQLHFVESKVYPVACHEGMREGVGGGRGW